MNNQVQLITYVDRLGGSDLGALTELLCGPLKGLFGGVHLLPFYFPIDGADAGFDPVDHTQVDPKLGQWADVSRLAQQVPVMADVIVNHMSSRSPQFQNYLLHGEQSPYAGLFLTKDSVFPAGADSSQIAKIYRPRPGSPFTPLKLADGSTREFWTTFTAEQIDIDVEHPKGHQYLVGILDRLASSGVTQIRLDACGYAIKRPNTACFMLDETFGFIREFSGLAKARGIQVLVEVHSYFQRQIDIAKEVDRVYDFALPPLVLHSFASKSAKALTDWLRIRPTNSVTVLDTHDGIGIIDIGSDPTDRVNRPGLISDTELDALVQFIHTNSRGQSQKATGAAASNLDLYQVNCTFFDALARDPNNYLVARALQLFVPGVPQVYYAGLLAATNDMQLLERTGVGRDINRPYYTKSSLQEALEQPLVQRFMDIIRLRNQHVAFQGEFAFTSSTPEQLSLTWSNQGQRASLLVDFAKPSNSRLEFTVDSDGTQSLQGLPLTISG